jgi:hypothetical protein
MTFLRIALASSERVPPFPSWAGLTPASMPADSRVGWALCCYFGRRMKGKGDVNDDEAPTYSSARGAERWR